MNKKHYDGRNKEIRTKENYYVNLRQIFEDVKNFIEGWAVRGPFELHYFLYEIEFWSGNLFDTLPSVKKRETVDHYLSRLTPNQYLRYVKHQYFVCQRLATMGSVASLKDYRPKDKKILQSFIKTLARMEVFWKELYTEASFKKLKGYE